MDAILELSYWSSLHKISDGFCRQFRQPGEIYSINYYAHALVCFSATKDLRVRVADVCSAPTRILFVIF